MKKFLSSFLLISVLFFVSCQEEIEKPDPDPSTIQELVETIIGAPMEEEAGNINVYLSKTTIAPGTEIETWNQTATSPGYESWFLFIDRYPTANWGHPCEYVFINPETLEYEIVEMNTPPNMIMELDVIREYQFESGGKLFDFSRFHGVESRSTTSANSNRYAVIISGGANMYNNHVRYWNDCSAIFSTLRHVYEYPQENIYVLMSDGTDPAPDRRLLNGSFDSSPLDLDGDGIPDIQYAATKENLEIVFNELAGKLTSNDHLFIFVTDHGNIDNNGTAYINLWGEDFYCYELRFLLEKVQPGTFNIVMEQCYSGGFIRHIDDTGRVIATACSETELSWATQDLLYNEFVYHWTAAVTGQDPYGNIVDADTNKDGRISMEEAFKYARDNDTRQETPQYSSIPPTLWQTVNLGRPGEFYYELNIYYYGKGREYAIPTDYKMSVNLPQIGVRGTYPINEMQEILLYGYASKRITEMEFELDFPYALFGNLSTRYWYKPPILTHSTQPYFYLPDSPVGAELRYRITPTPNATLRVGVKFEDPDPRYD